MMELIEFLKSVEDQIEKGLMDPDLPSFDTIPEGGPEAVIAELS